MTTTKQPNTGTEIEIPADLTHWRADEAQTLPPAECTPWCIYGDGKGHADAWHPDDQWCGSEAHDIELTRHPLVTVDVQVPIYRRDTVTASLCRKHEGAPHVVLDHEAAVPARSSLPAFEIQLSKAEAIRLADALRELAGQL